MENVGWRKLEAEVPPSLRDPVSTDAWEQMMDEFLAEDDRERWIAEIVARHPRVGEFLRRRHES